MAESVCKNVAVIEREDGSTYTQDYQEFEDLLELIEMLGSSYLVVDIYRKDYL